MRLYFMIDMMSLPDPEGFGLDYNNVTVERVPLIVAEPADLELIKEKESTW